jgi:hypothetical protein
MAKKSPKLTHITLKKDEAALIIDANGVASLYLPEQDGDVPVSDASVTAVVLSMAARDIKLMTKLHKQLDKMVAAIEAGKPLPKN